MRRGGTWKNFLIYFLVDMLYNKDIQFRDFFLMLFLGLTEKKKEAKKNRLGGSYSLM